MMQINAGDYYQRAPRCCPGRMSQVATTTMATGNSDRSLRISTTIRGAELLCCCCSCSTTTAVKSPGLLASLGVCLLVFAYTLLGAFAFMALEGGFKQTEILNEVTVANVGITPRTIRKTKMSSNSGAKEILNEVTVANVEITPRTIRKTKMSSNSGAKEILNEVTVANVGITPRTITKTELSSNSGAKVIDANGSSSVSFSSSSSSETTSTPPPSLMQASHHELDLEDSSTRQLRAYTVERLWSITEDLNVLYKENWTRLAEREVLDFQEKMAQHSLDRASRSGHSIYGTTAVQRASGSSTRRNHDRRGPGEKGSLVKGQRRWTFGSSFLYSLTLITTIGCGSTSPRTVWGRLITIVYALAGIPLMLVYLSTVGDVLARSFRRLYSRACGRVECGKRRDRRDARGRQSSPTSGPAVPGIIGKTSYHRYDNHIETKLASAGHFYSSKSNSCDELGLQSTGSGMFLDCGSEGLLHAPTSNTDVNNIARGGKRQRTSNNRNDHHHQFYPCSQMSSLGGISGGYAGEPVCLVRIPISVSLVIILLYICCGALMFNRLEGWTLLEGSYFCFTSLGTIGFGDLVPTGGNTPTHIFEELSLCACSLYILAGMGLIAMCFNLMQDEVVRVVRVFGRTCGMSPISNSTAGRIINAPPTGIKSDLNDTERDFIGLNCGNITDDSRLAPSHIHEREIEHSHNRDDDHSHEHENGNETIAMSLVSAS